ncbi:uncharacterized protein C1orf226 homolog [Thalassophryne amazonica]|uniref:uncharacterized protein C1orf226 homolog n=1 Tax=Thalassophryne amazonica TaxID=390379 RepID=UPI0014713DA8|nr:uncharacterized protein C1orf226 homolog [Thalassophryne amazonica]
MPPENYFSPRVDQSMFENSVAQQQSPLTSRTGLPSARRSPGSANRNPSSGSIDSPSSGGQQRLKNAINLGKAVGAKVNDLLRRKEPSHLGDIGVTEVNKNIGAVWNCVDQVNRTTASSHFSIDSFPRLDPPPPSGKKRIPRALKTTQDMMISSDPVVSSPDPADSTSFLSSPEKSPLFAEKEMRSMEVEPQEDKEQEELKAGEEHEDSPRDPEEQTGDADRTITRHSDQTDGQDFHLKDEVVDGGTEVPQHLLHLSVPDLINKDPPLLEARSKSCDVWQKASESDSRLASTPLSGKTPCRISLGEELQVGNGALCGRSTAVSGEDAEPHPDLLSFE